MHAKLEQKLNKLQAVRKNKKGFTLIEIIVVLAILALLIAIALPTMNGVLTDAKDKVVLADARAAYVAYSLLDAEKGTVTYGDLLGYLDKTGTTDVTVSVKVDTTTKKVTEFNYTDSRITGKHVNMPLGETDPDLRKATVVGSAIPEGNGYKVLKAAASGGNP